MSQSSANTGSSNASGSVFIEKSFAEDFKVKQSSKLCMHKVARTLHCKIIPQVTQKSTKDSGKQNSPTKDSVKLNSPAKDSVK